MLLLLPYALQVGGSTVSKAIVAASGVSEARIRWVGWEGGSNATQLIKFT